MPMKSSGVMYRKYIKPRSNPLKPTSSNQFKRPLQVELGTEIYTEQSAKEAEAKQHAREIPKPVTDPTTRKQRQLSEYL